MSSAIPAAVCIVGGDGNAEGIIELRWIDPERFGRFAWNFLFGTLLRLTVDPSLMNDWHSFIYLLPFALPCHSCKVCCARFLKESPPPSETTTMTTVTVRTGGNELFIKPVMSVKTIQPVPSVKTIQPVKIIKPVPPVAWPAICLPIRRLRTGGACPVMTTTKTDDKNGGTKTGCGCTPDRCRAWLCRLRRDVRSRNLTAGDPLTVANRMQGHFEPETDEQMAARFTNRSAFPDLWLMDAYIFLATVILTADYGTDAGRNHVVEFLKYAIRLSALSLGFSVPPSLDRLSTVETAMDWLQSGKNAPDRSVFDAMLELLPVRKRRVRRKI